VRDSQEPAKLVAQGLDTEEWREVVERLAVPHASE